MSVLRAACLSMLVAEIVAEGQLRGSIAQRGDEGPYLEVPDEADAENPKPEIAGWEKSLNATSLEASASYWGNGFCAAHHVGYWCQGFTRVRCCRNHWGFVRCGSFVHHRGCGWHGWGGGYRAGPYNEVAQGESSAEPDEAEAEKDAGVYPDETTGYDEVGPFLAVPDESEAENPKPAIAGWDNSTSLQAAAFHSWGRSFCQVHHAGYFCDGVTRVRCCQQQWGFVKCGTTAHARSCGYRGGSFPVAGTGAGSPWVIHPGWVQSSFCRAHHVGLFCYQHSRVHCCNDHGHFVQCTTRAERSFRC